MFMKEIKKLYFYRNMQQQNDVSSYKMKINKKERMKKNIEKNL